MATQKWRCVSKCFVYKKRFKVGQYFPLEWIDSGASPNPPDAPHKTWFVPEAEYDDYVRKNRFDGKITSAGTDPRSTAVLIEELSKYMGDIPKTWKRSQIWSALIARENAVSKTDTVARGPGRPAKKD